MYVYVNRPERSMISHDIMCANNAIELPSARNGFVAGKGREAEMAAQQEKEHEEETGGSTEFPGDSRVRETTVGRASVLFDSMTNPGSAN